MSDNFGQSLADIHSIGQFDRGAASRLLMLILNIYLVYGFYGKLLWYREPPFKQRKKPEEI
jgi:hypothetical protein